MIPELLNLKIGSPPLVRMEEASDFMRCLAPCQHRLSHVAQWKRLDPSSYRARGLLGNLGKDFCMRWARRLVRSRLRRLGATAFALAQHLAASPPSAVDLRHLANRWFR